MVVFEGRSGLRARLTNLWAVVEVQVVEAAYSGYRAFREHCHGIASKGGSDVN